jgi:FHA domain-containing protein
MIKIAVTSYENAAPAEAISAVFDHQRRTLGRGEGNFLVLPDPKNEVARLQAGIWKDGAHHVLVNLSPACPVLLNGSAVPGDREMALMAGDELRIGSYVLRTEAVDTAARGAPVAVAEPVAPAAVPVVAPVVTAAVAPVVAPVVTAAAAPVVAPVVTVAVAPVVAPAVMPAPPATPVSTPAPAPVARPAAPPAPRTAAAPAPAADVQALKEALLRGAGLPGTALTTDLTPELMETLGQVLAAAMQGTIGLLAHRHQVRQDVKTDVTTVVIRNNNPLKFFPDSETVLMQMLRRKMPGFMPPQEAVLDAFQDLHSHQLAVVAGMRASLRANTDTLLAQLRPDQFDATVPAPTLMEKLVPSKRQAALWQLYTAHYARVAAGSGNNAKNVFGAPFQAAYEFEIGRNQRGSSGA